MTTLKPLTIACLLATAATAQSQKMETGPFTSSEPYGLTVVLDRQTTIAVAPAHDRTDSPWRPQDEAQLPYPTVAPDGSYFGADMTKDGNAFRFEYAPLNDHEVGAMLSAPADMDVELRWKEPFKGCMVGYWMKDGALEGFAYIAQNARTTAFRATAQPTFTATDAWFRNNATTRVRVTASQPALLLLSVGGQQTASFADIQPAIEKARQDYENQRLTSSGDWDDFASAVARTLNASRVYSSVDKHISHTIGRGWWMTKQAETMNPDDLAPYFAWDNFFNANLASLEDPEGAKETVCALLAYQYPDGMVGSFCHWYCDQSFGTPHRTNPPVGSLCVWRLYEHTADADFLREVYPALLRWHDWFLEGRRRPGDTLLSWGSRSGHINDARLECGWDDNQAFDSGEMVDGLLNMWNVDLNALWSMDTEFLARIARTIGRTDDAERLERQHEAINKAINDKLWNEELGLYCHRLVDDDADGTPHFVDHISAMNFYPLACGAPSKSRAKRILKYFHQPEKFWGEYVVPTIPYDQIKPEWGYWRGKVWGPVNYILWQGILRYDDEAHQAEYARRSVNLFMKHWNTPQQVCGENYWSQDGAIGDCPHYTWGALLPLIGMEALLSVDDNLRPQPRNLPVKADLQLRNVRVGGHLYNVNCKQGKVSIAQQ